MVKKGQGQRKEPLDQQGKVQRNRQENGQEKSQGPDNTWETAKEMGKNGPGKESGKFGKSH